jgi:hypothetical protein
MTRNLKVLGLALVAALAMSAVAASAASAVQHTVVTTANPTYFTGNQATQNIFSTPAGEVKCNTTLFTGSITGTSNSSVETTPTYSGCEHSLVGAAPVKNEGCKYLLTGNTTEAGHEGHGVVHVVCGAGKHITIELSGVFGLVNCNLTIGSQTPTKGGVNYTQQGSGTTHDILVTATVEEIAYTKVPKSGGSGCGLVGGNGHDGKYFGSVTVKGFSNSGHTTHAPITIE